MSDLFEKLAAKEREFFQSEFLSPVMKNQKVKVRIEGIIMEFSVRPKDYQGWGVFKTFDRENAEFVREATRLEKKEYLSLLPSFQFVICKQGKRTLGFPTNQNDSRLKVSGLVPILLPEEVRLFHSVVAKYDGHNFWFEKRDSRRSVRISNSLRDSLAEEVKPDDLEVSGITPEESAAYRFAYDFEVESKRDRQEEKIRDALTRAGAEYRSYVERGATYTVEYSVDGERHRSTIDKDTLQVKSAGICLNGTDKNFDLQSLVTVVREAQDRRLIYRMGDNR